MRTRKNWRILFTIFFLTLAACNNSETNLIHVKLDRFNIDTAGKVGLFKDIIATEKSHTPNSNIIQKIIGYIFLDEIQEDSSAKKIIVEIYSNKQGKYIRIDTDRDKVLTDEEEIKISSNNKVVAIKNCKILAGNKTTKTDLFLKPIESELFKSKNKFDVSNIGLLYYPIKQQGILTIKNKYKISLFKYDDQAFTESNSFIFIEKYGNHEEKPIANKWDDKLYLDRHILKFSKIDKAGNYLELERIGQTEKQLGYLKGDYSLDLTGRDVLTNKEVRLIDEKEKFTLIDFWGTWCTPCLKSTDDLKRLDQKYNNHLKIIGVACDTDSNKVRKYITQKNINYPNIYEPKDGSNASRFIVRDFPTYILLDSDGKIIYRAAGYDNFQELKIIIDNYMRQ